jgi:hypothetical protein
VHPGNFTILYNMFGPLLAVETVRGHVTAATSALDVDTCKLPGRRDGAASNEDVVGLRSRQDIAVNVVHEDVGDVHAVSRLSGGTTVHWEITKMSAARLDDIH